MSCAPGDILCQMLNCSGAVGPGQALFSYWQNNNCPVAYSQFINGFGGGNLQYTPEGQSIAQNYVQQLFDTYFITNSLTDNVTSPQYNPFQNTLLSLCTDPTLPGVCAIFLNNYCSSYTRDEVINSPVLTNFCGCYVPPDPTYLQYTLGTPECNQGITGCQTCTGGPGCTGQPACDPLCHRALTSQKSNDTLGIAITCPQNVCVIDGVTVNVQGSNIPGGINFNSVCPGCSNGNQSCLCVVSGVNVSATMADIGVGVNFNQLCGPSSVCLVEDNDGNIISAGACTGIDAGNIPITTPSSTPNIGIILIMLLIVLIFLFVSITLKFTPQEITYV